MRANWDILYQDKYRLSDELVEKTIHFSEFANGGAQATVKLKDGTMVNEVLLSGSRYVIAINGHETMPFDITDIVDVFQTQDDIDNRDRTKWSVWKT